jgi:hypothetical protein
VGGDGVIRVLSSKDGESWNVAATLSEKGIDLRDPKLSTTPAGRLMLTLGGSVYVGKTLQSRQSRVAFSDDGRSWSHPERVLSSGDWLWRITWHDGKAYGIVYTSPIKSKPTDEWTARLVTSTNGVNYSTMSTFTVPGRPNEGTVRFLPDGTAVALLRREAADKSAWIGSSKPPFTDWSWKSAGLSVGGPNFIVLPSGKWIASGRQTKPSPTGPKTFVGKMDSNSVTPELILPSGGDTSYAGMVWHDGLLWLSYYSSHEGPSAIYLAKVRLD